MRDNDSMSIPFYPASYDLDNIIAVAATNQSDGLASFSNYGTTSVDLGAPGVNTYSTIPARDKPYSVTTLMTMISLTGQLDGTNDTWAVTSEAKYSGTYSLADSPGANYLADTDSYAVTPSFDLSSEEDCKLTYLLEIDTESGVDYLYVEVSTNGTNWTTLVSRSGTTSSFTEYDEDLKAYDGQSTVYIRFRLSTDRY